MDRTYYTNAVLYRKSAALDESDYSIRVRAGTALISEKFALDSIRN
jgi:hypothetical protein